MSFVRAAIEAFGLDADSLLMDVIAEEEQVLTPFGWNNDAPETAQEDDPEVPDWEAVPGADVSFDTVHFLNGVKNPAERASLAAHWLGKAWQSMVRPVGDEAAAP